MSFKKFEHLNSQGNPWVIVTIEQLCGDLYALKYNKPEQLADKETWLSLILKARDEAINLGAGTVGIRLRLDYQASIFQSILSELGFKKIAGRIEYQQDLSLLPDDQNTPIIWKAANELSWSEQQIANFTHSVLEGDPSIDPNERPEDFIQDWIKHEELTHGEECISIGFYNNQPVALVVAQVNRQSGWSRISYMGLIPEFRKKGLGRWIHKHGFQMMKDQGGSFYHGGTHIENLAMRNLFESHGCKFFCEMEEWAFYKSKDKNHD